MIKNYSYKFRLYPTKDQKILLSKHFGCVRFIYNHFLDKNIKLYAESKEKDLAKKYSNYYDNSAELPKLKKEKETEWLSEVSAATLQHVLKNLDSAYNSFFKKLRDFPKFKKKSGKNSFHVPQNILITDNKLHIPKFREGISIVVDRSIEGKIKHATISKTTSGKYYASILVERDIQPLPTINKTVGVDLGIKSLAICSDGKTYQNIQSYRSLESRIKLKHKELSRTLKGSKGREKARKRLAKLYEKSANIRNNHIHQMTKRIINENQVIVLESLAVKNMVKNYCLAKSISDVAWSEVVRQLEYKADWYGRKIVKIDRWFPSSKMCGNCHHINGSLTLADREWTCSSCHTHHDRDLNAANNILNEGLNLLNVGINSKRTVGTTGIADCPNVSLNDGNIVKQLVGSEVSNDGS